MSHAQGLSAPIDAVHGIQRDTHSGLYWCGLCTCVASASEEWQRMDIVAVGTTSADVECHLNSAEHLSCLENHLLYVTEFLPVIVDDIPMLLDHQCIFPHTMFGLGCAVYDESLGMLLSCDAAGAVRLFPNHRYRTVRLEASAASQALPATRERVRGGIRGGALLRMFREQRSLVLNSRLHEPASSTRSRMAYYSQRVFERHVELVRRRNRRAAAYRCAASDLGVLWRVAPSVHLSPVDARRMVELHSSGGGEGGAPSQGQQQQIVEKTSASSDVNVIAWMEVAGLIDVAVPPSEDVRPGPALVFATGESEWLDRGG